MPEDLALPGSQGIGAWGASTQISAYVAEALYASTSGTMVCCKVTLNPKPQTCNPNSPKKRHPQARIPQTLSITEAQKKTRLPYHGIPHRSLEEPFSKPKPSKA